MNKTAMIIFLKIEKKNPYFQRLSPLSSGRQEIVICTFNTITSTPLLSHLLSLLVRSSFEMKRCWQVNETTENFILT
jgi:hypothetical protein